jgi:hypothetical protein
MCVFVAVAVVCPARADKPVALFDGVQVDVQQGKLSAVASCAADLLSPSAEIARVKAERLATNRARERLKKALAQLVRDHKDQLARFGGPEQVAKLDPKQAVVAQVDYGATGAVVVKLVLSLSGAKTPENSEKPPENSGKPPKNSEKPAEPPAEPPAKETP